MQRELRTLAHRAYEEAYADHGHQQPGRSADHLDGLSRNRRRLGKHRVVVERAEVREHEADAEDEAEVSHAVDQERLHVRVDGRGTRVPEPDQQVGHEADRLPAEEKLQEVVRHHQHQHREGEERDIGEEPLVARVLGHVADGVDVDHQRHEGHHDHHDRREAVDQESDLQPRFAAGDPGVDAAVVGVSGPDVGEDHAGGEERHQHRQDGQGVRAHAPHRAAEQAGNDRARQGREGHYEVEGLHRNHLSVQARAPIIPRVYPLSESRSSTLIVLRLRNSTTRIARPMADSAAATVRMKNTNT